MEIEKTITPSSRSIELLQQIKSGLSQYQKDRKKVEVWNKIFWTLGIYMGKDGLISSQAQETINFYLQKKTQASLFGPLIQQNKEVIGKIYDFSIQAAGSIDSCLSKGNISEIINRKLEKVFVGQPPKSPTIQLVNYCIQIVLLHFCEFINQFKNSNGNCITHTNRKIIKTLKKKTNFIITYDLFQNQIMDQPITLLQGYLQNVKPHDHFNMENLLELTNRSFKNKRALLTGFQYPTTKNHKIDLFGKVINFNSIFDSSYHSRELIEKKLNTLTLTSTPDIQINQTWSLLTCVTNNQPFLASIFEKLPMFLRPRSNGDILSFLRKKIIPTYKYQVLKKGYSEGPFLLEFMQVFTNVGKTSFQIISIPNTNETQLTFLKHQGQNLWEIIENLEVPYSKVKVSPQSIAIIPANHFYLISASENSNPANNLSETIIWNIFPKELKSIKNTSKAITDKQKLYPGYIHLPLSLMFLDYLNHEYLEMKQQISTYIVSHIEQQLIQQEKVINDILTNNPKITLNITSINYHQRFCFHCKTPYLNYCCQTEKKEFICMNCVKKYPQEFKVQEIFAMYFPQNLRYPMTLLKIKIAKDKQPSEDLESPYEKSVCPGKFIGSFKIYNCKTIENQDMKNLSNFPLTTDLFEQITFHNIQKQLKIVSSQQMVIELSTKIPKSQQELNQITQKIKAICKNINNPIELTKKLTNKINNGNLVTHTINILIPTPNFHQ